MDEKRYAELADATFRRILEIFDEVDVELAEAESVGDVITITFAGGARSVVNTQRPARQIWLAADSHAYHFSWDEGSGTWLDDKGRGELFDTLRRIARDHHVTLGAT